MSSFHHPETPVIFPKDSIRIIADSAIQSGITLFGGLIGSGKALTTEAIVERVKKNNNFNRNHVFYIDTCKEQKAGRVIKETVEALMDKYEDAHLLVVFDEVNHKDTMLMAIELAKNGHSALGITECCIPISLASVLEGATSWITDTSVKIAITAEVLENLNLVGLQKTQKQQTTYSLTYRDKQDFVALLNDSGIDSVYKEINLLAVNH